VWRFSIQVPLAAVAEAGHVLIELWDHDLLSQDDLIGAVRVPASHGPCDSWFRVIDLTQPGVPRGQVRVLLSAAVPEVRLSPRFPARGRPLRDVYPEYPLASTFTGPRRNPHPNLVGTTYRTANINHHLRGAASPVTTSPVI
jgi:hypothetical protein